MLDWYFFVVTVGTAISRNLKKKKKKRSTIKTNDRQVVNNARLHRIRKGSESIGRAKRRWRFYRIEEIEFDRREIKLRPISASSSMKQLVHGVHPHQNKPIRTELSNRFALQTKWRMIYRACENEITKMHVALLSVSLSLSIEMLVYVSLWSICCRDCVSSSDTRVILAEPSRAFIRSSSNHYVAQGRTNDVFIPADVWSQRWLTPRNLGYSASILSRTCRLLITVLCNGFTAL